MSILLASVLALVVLAVLFGLGLALASDFCHVDVDPKVEAITDALPQINCGACGYKGCVQYAQAAAKGGVGPNLCVPGGEDVAKDVAAIMGVEAQAVEPKRAVVHCQGGSEECPARFEYVGIEDCLAASLVQGGPKPCPDGCLGLGSCAAACPFDAITMTDNRLPAIDPQKCTACGICVRTCPRGIIEILPTDCAVYIGCSTHGKGKAVKALCSKGCIACQLCVKKTESGAITMDDNLPVIDYDKGRDFDAAVEKCPMNCFVVEKAGQV